MEHKTFLKYGNIYMRKFYKGISIICCGCSLRRFFQAPTVLQYRSTSLCQTCLSRIHGLCRSDHPFPNFSPILHCNSTLLMSNSVIMKTRLFWSDFSVHKANFPFVYHCLYRSGQKVKRSNDKQVIYLIDRTIALISAQIIHCCK